MLSVDYIFVVLIIWKQVAHLQTNRAKNVGKGYTPQDSQIKHTRK